MSPSAKSHPVITMMPSEVAHFHFGAISPAAMAGKMGPFIKAYARGGFRKPKEVSRILNENQIRTACGDMWTPRLAGFLLQLIFNGRLPDFPSVTTKKQEGVNLGGHSTSKRFVDRKAKHPAKGKGPSPTNLVKDGGGGKPEGAHAPGTARRRRSRGSLSQAAPDPRSRAITAPKGFTEKLPAMNLLDTRQTWLNALAVLSDGARRHLHSAAQQIVEDIEAEWLRRQVQVVTSDGYFPWPTTWAPQGEGNVADVDWLRLGPLAFLGYHVGRTIDTPSPIRQSILTRVFVGVIPPAFPQDYLRAWGSPSSPSRLRKMAESIAAFARNAKRRRQFNLDEAIWEWEIDLQFLYTKYYVGRFQFAWPSTK